MPLRCGYRACLHYLFPVCFFSACGQSRCGGGYNGMELYRGACVQYARPCRCGQNGRPCCKRNDGTVRRKNFGSENQSGDPQLYGIHVFRAVYAAVPFFRPCLRHTSMPRKQGKIKKTPCGYPFMPKMQGE